MTQSKRKANQRHHYWERHVSGYDSSGLSQKAYCERHGLTVSTFKNWIYKLSKCAEERAVVSSFSEVQSKSIEPSQDFLTVNIPPSKALDADKGVLLLITDRGMQLKLPINYPAEHLKVLLGVE